LPERTAPRSPPQAVAILLGLFWAWRLRAPVNPSALHWNGCEAAAVESHPQDAVRFTGAVIVPTVPADFSVPLMRSSDARRFSIV
jgi:hypothetical protein